MASDLKGAAPPEKDQENGHILSTLSEVHPLERVNFISRSAVSWATPLLKLGSRKPLAVSDVWNLPAAMRAAPLGAKFSQNFERARTYRAYKACFFSFGGYFFWGMTYLPAYIGLSVLKPLSLKAMIRFLNNEEKYMKEPWLGIESGWALVAVAAACSFGITMAQNGFHLQSILLGSSCRTAIMDALYRKVLGLSEAALQQSSLGQIVTLTAADLERVFQGAQQQLNIISAPVLVLLCLVFVMMEIGVWATMAGFALQGIVMPLNFCAATLMGKYRGKALQVTDTRVRFMNEILGGIRIVKLHAWEGHVEKHVQSLRNKETAHNAKAVLLKAWSQSTGYVMPALIPFVMFATYSAMGNELTMEKVFAVLAIMNVMRLPMQMLPRATSGLMQAMVSLRRCEAFLSLPERHVGWEAMNGTLEATATGTVDVELQKACCRWGGDEEKKVLQKLAKTAPKKGKGKGKRSSVSVDEDTSKGSGKGKNDFDGSKGQDGKGKDGKGKNGKGKDGKGKKGKGKDGKGEGSDNDESGTDLADGSKGKGEKGGKGGKGKSKGLEETTDNSTDAAGTINGAGDADVSKAKEMNGSDKKMDRVDESTNLVLADITLAVPRGQKVAIVGKVGAGKSSLLYGMLGELEVTSGTIARTSPTVPYCNQQPWIQSLTIKENILFGLEEDAIVYEKAIDASQLKPDLQILPHGDATYIGENGINLSGGQKARTALARAFYAALKDGSPLILLDDPIAAVDAFVAHAVFGKGFLDLLKDQTVILTLNAHLDLLSSFDRVIALDSGRVAVDGSLEDVMEAFPWVRDAVGTSKAKEEAHSERKEPGKSNGIDKEATADKAKAKAESELEDKKDEKDEKSSKPLYEPEDRVEGRVQLQNYIEWARCALAGSNGTKAGGACLLFLIIFVFALAQAIRLSLDVWLARWADGEEDTAHAVGIYGILAGSFLLSVLLRATVFFGIALRSCRAVHEMVLGNVLMAPVNLFFDVTPSGRILNRFSSDLEKVDDQLPEKMFMFGQTAIQVASGVVMCISSSPFVIIGIPLIFFVFYKIFILYQRSARELKRLDGISRSPLLQHFSESIKGLSTIRAYNAAPRFVHKYQNLVDTQAKVFTTFWLCSRWLATRVDLCAASLQTLVALIAIAWKDHGDPVVVGVALVWGFQLSGMMQMCVRAFAEVENSATGVERLVAYKHVPQEAEYLLEPRPIDTWPAGDIELRNVCARYRPGLPLVLNNVSLHVFAGERVGICGRTGSGKSTTALVLFRMLEVDSGQVIIDGIDAKTIGLKDLRQRMAMIPQDPVLFRMTVRENLDPFQMHTDEQIWKSLEQVALGEAIRALDGDLSFLCAEQGSNFSLGQKQLLCIARTLMKVPGVVMMDEATANIDSFSDEVIQRTIRSHFRAVTVLTIAHRLSTIADSNKIAVFEKGELCEYGTPEELVDKGGALAAFFKEAGIELPVRQKPAGLHLEAI